MGKGCTIVKFLHKNIFTRFGTPKAIISDEGTHFCNKIFATAVAMYSIKYKIATSYHPLSNGQEEVYNKKIKWILVKVVSTRLYDIMGLQNRL